MLLFTKMLFSEILDLVLFDKQRLHYLVAKLASVFYNLKHVMLSYAFR